MAISGVHVVCGYAVLYRGATLFVPVWSETIAFGGTTGQAVPPGGNGSADMPRDDGLSYVFRVRAPSTTEIFVAVGSSPDASQTVSTKPANTRQHLVASELADIPAQVGFKLHAVSA